MNSALRVFLLFSLLLIGHTSAQSQDYRLFLGNRINRADCMVTDSNYCIVDLLTPQGTEQEYLLVYWHGDADTRCSQMHDAILDAIREFAKNMNYGNASTSAESGAIYTCLELAYEADQLGEEARWIKLGIKGLQGIAVWFGAPSEVTKIGGAVAEKMIVPDVPKGQYNYGFRVFKLTDQLPICRCNGNTVATSTTWGYKGKQCGTGKAGASGQTYDATFYYNDSCRVP